MSYEIIYRKQFIKVSDTQFIPMVLIGSNNCYETTNNGRDRRERDWCNLRFITNGKIFATLEEMLSNVNNHREDIIKRNEETLKQYPDWEKYSDNNFGYFSSLSIGGNGTHRTTFGMYKGIVTDGCKKALTVEQLLDLNIPISVSNGYMSRFLQETYKSKNIVPKTTDELLKAISELEEYYNGSGVNVIVTFINSVDYINNILARENKIKRSKNNKIKKHLTEFYVIRIPNLGYYVRKTKFGFKYSFFGENYINKRFQTEKQALSYANKNIHREIAIEKIKLN